MNQERLLAGALTIFCAIAAFGSWVRQTPAPGATTPALSDGASLLGARQSVAQLDIGGMITDGGSEGGFGATGTSAQNVLAAIGRIRADGSPVVLLNINSPGGTAAASQAIYDELMRLKAEKKTKIVTTMGDMAASGGYYIAAASDVIVANPATLTGSIGVIMHTQNLQGLMGKLGVENGAITSGPHKDIASPFKPMSSSDRQILQGIVDDSYRQFLNAVAAGRRMKLETLKPLADGRIYTGQQALGVHLVDKLGNYNVAVAEARRLGGLSSSAGVQNYSETSWEGWFRSLLSSQLGPLGRLGASARGRVQLGEFDQIPLMLYE